MKCLILEWIYYLCKDNLIHIKNLTPMQKLRYHNTAVWWNLIIICVLLVSCGQKPVKISLAERKSLDSIISSSRNLDTLSMLQKRMESEGNMLGSVIAYKEMGKIMRNESLFDDALRLHSEGLKQAEAIGDTLEMVQALNNIGTDYRRMGVLDLAQDYHYRAWMISKDWHDTSYDAKKNRVVSLNGLGNIYLTLGNYARADSALRMALEGEKELHSDLGQAINYANIGSIFRHRGMEDSAWVYFRKSMELNQRVDNTLGISLCHTDFGSMYERAHQYDKAIAEYEKAYELMEASDDEWHMLNSLIALAGVNMAMGNDGKAMTHLDKAKQVANEIKSYEHLEDIYYLYYKHYKRVGDYSAALASHEKATAMRDSVVDMEKMNRIQNAGLLVERNQQARVMDEAHLNLESEKSARFLSSVIFTIVVVILVGVFVVFFYMQRIHRRNHLALKRLAAMRETFFTNITHEFRTPLTVILGLSQDLQKNGQEEVKDRAQTIERQGKGLLTLINQLLDISKIKSQVGNLDWRNGSITTYVTMIVDTYRDYARTKNIDLQFYAKEAVTMDFVPDYVNKVLNNLISNAIKFTPEYGKINVTLWRKESVLHVEVSDTGEGMDKETADNVFKPFYQGETASKHIGTGVGLALVKQVIDAVDGRISVESRVGEGTTFHIEMPINNVCKNKLGESVIYKADSMPEIPIEEKALADSDGADNQCTVLVIEDNRDIAAYIGNLLSGSYNVAYAANGEDGMQKAIDIVPDLIITDLMMPGMDGLELCRRVRANNVVNHIPIVIVTAKISEQERIAGIEAGADAYLAKPFNVDELRTVVERLLDRQRSLRSKFSESIDTNNNKEEEEVKLTDAERRFLAKTVDHIYLLLDKQQLDVNTLSDKLCMSSRQFHRKIVALTGCSPASFMLKIKMKRARHLLETDSRMSIDEIASRCGFEHTSSFYHAFRKAYGVTPKDVRRGVGLIEN